MSEEVRFISRSAVKSDRSLTILGERMLKGFGLRHLIYQGSFCWREYNEQPKIRIFIMFSHIDLCTEIMHVISLDLRCLQIRKADN